jgi:hypothetical protein
VDAIIHLSPEGKPRYRFMPPCRRPPLVGHRTRSGVRVERWEVESSEGERGVAISCRIRTQPPERRGERVTRAPTAEGRKRKGCELGGAGVGETAHLLDFLRVGLFFP